MDYHTRKIMFSSVKQDWATPQHIFDQLDQEFHFTLDPCCTERTAKCKKFFTPETDGLSRSWEGETCFVNPPFGREQATWIKKGYEESQKPNTTVVFLIPQEQIPVRSISTSMEKQRYDSLRVDSNSLTLIPQLRKKNGQLRHFLRWSVF